MHRRLIWFLEIGSISVLCCRDTETRANANIGGPLPVPAALVATTSFDGTTNSKGAPLQGAKVTTNLKVGAKDAMIGQIARPPAIPTPRYYASELCLVPAGVDPLVGQLNQNSQGGYDLVAAVSLPDHPVKNPSTGETVV